MLYLEKGMFGHPENEEMAFVRVKFGHRFLLGIVQLHELWGQPGQTEP